MAIPVKLPVFEGPLDLLMHLIEKNKIDIYDIPIVEITDQYLEYVHQMDHEDMDVTSEFLVMAATLLDIKSRMLLPREKDEETGEEEGDPREELVRRLLEYKMYKYMSEELAVCREQAGVRYYRAQNLPREVRTYQPPIDYEELLSGTDLKRLEEVFGEVLRRKKSRRDPIRSGFGKIRREEVNIDTKTLYIRAYLQAHPRTDFRALLESQESKEEVIVTFLILLELMKNQKVQIVQDSICGKILIESSETGENSSSALPETTPGDDSAETEITAAEALAGEETAAAQDLAGEEAAAGEDLAREETAVIEETAAGEDSAGEITVAVEDVPVEVPEEEENTPANIPEGKKTDNAPADSYEEESEDTAPPEETDIDSSGISSLSFHSRMEVASPVLPFVPEYHLPAADPVSASSENMFTQVRMPAAFAEEIEISGSADDSAEEAEISKKVDTSAEETPLMEKETPAAKAPLMEDKLPGAEAARTEEETPAPEVPQQEADSPAEDAPLAEEETPADTALRAEETPFAEEVSPLPFSAHLWYGRTPRHISPLCDFKNGAVCIKRSAWQTASRGQCRENPAWEQTRLSRLWARRL